MIICELRDVSKKYGQGSNEVRALDRVNIAFHKGDFLAISGPSGSGKTTMLNLIGLLDSPTEGKVFLEDRDVSALKPKVLAKIRAQRIGFVFQSFNLIPVLTVLENVEMALQLAHHPGPKRKLSIEALEAVGLGSMLHRKPHELSGGQQQRVAVARALVKKPALVIADEPTANLDSKTGGQIIELMKTLNREQQTTFLLSTHDPMVMDKAASIVRLKDGRILDEA